MKLFILLCLSAVFCASASVSYSQEVKITLNLSNATVREALDEIKKQSEFSFWYRNEEVDLNRAVTISVDKQGIDNVLTKLLSEQNLSYKIDDKHIIIYKKTGELLASQDRQQSRRITGIVTDENGEPIIGANVKVKGSTTGTATDVDGKFTLTVTDNAVLQVSYLGYIQQEISAGNQSGLTIVLSEDTQALDEVVVVGFQTQKKVNLTGAVSTVSAETFENRPVANIGQALQGVVPNLNISIANGAPNTVPSFNIRGGTSIEKNSSGDWVVTNDAPLILVNGVEVSATMLNQMNPNDIESISVIQDASAAAIYGTKATFGVLLIQSKNGSFNQKAKVSYSFDFSADRPAALPDIMNSYDIQQATMNKTAWTGGSVSSVEELRLNKMKEYAANPTHENAWYEGGWVANINPYKELIRDWTPTQKHNLSISGGSQSMSYYVSMGYQYQEGMYKINTDQYNRYNSMMGLNAKVTDRFNLSAKVSYNSTSYKAPYLVAGKGNLWNAMRNETDRNINMPITTGPNDPIPNEYTDNILAWISYGAFTESHATTSILSISPELIILPEALKLKAD
ncbi:MAG: SusC/RagA family TonB-linked outer membrane protein, partial [Tannerella sp.]|nr:SusC/RagA family TonB-linked outer membrane protein [Tannerella sp.]